MRQKGFDMVTKNILVINDCSKQCDDEHTLQLISKAHDVSIQMACRVEVLCFGINECADEMNRLYEYGADSIYFYKNTSFGLTDYRHFAEVVSTHINKQMPELVLIPTSTMGKSLSSILSNRFGAGLTADCIDIQLSERQELIFIRAAMSDTVLAKIVCINCELKLGTVKPNVFKSKKRTTARQEIYEKIDFETRINTPLYTVLSTRQYAQKCSVDFNRYSTIFCLGRGVKDQQNIDRFFALAEKMQVGIAVTRTLVEENLVDKEYQVGQSGKSISPKIYVSFGLSGASQHIVGIKNADVIVAVNHDKNAPIFDFSDIVVEEDLNLILAEMEARFIQ